MCGRYVVATPFQQLALNFEAAAEDCPDSSRPPAEGGRPDSSRPLVEGGRSDSSRPLVELGFEPSYNIAPTTRVPVVWQRPEDEGARRLALARWGLVPSWAKDPAIGVRAFNARVETAAEKPMFRSAFSRRRCVLPADGYYEWKKGEGRTKQPMFIHATDGAPLGLAGLYERWKDAEGRALWSVTVLTGPALGPLAEIHDRRPLVIAPDLVEAWLDADLREPERIRSLLQVDLVPDWRAHPVGPEVGNVRNDGPGLVREITAPGTLF